MTSLGAQEDDRLSVLDEIIELEEREAELKFSPGTTQLTLVYQHKA